MRTLRRPRPHLDTVALAVAVIAAMLLLLWAADWLARRGAESVLGRMIQEETGTAEPPSVDVHGGLFLPQVLRGRYDRVDIEMDGLVSGPLRLEAVSAELTDVYLPFSDLLRGRAERLVVARAEEQALLTYDDLNRYLELTGRSVVVETAGGDELELTGSVDVLDRTLEASAEARLRAEGGALVVEPTRVGAARELDRLSEVLLGQRFSFRVPLDPLPFAQSVTEIEATPDGVRIQAAGTGVVLGP